MKGHVVVNISRSLSLLRPATMALVAVLVLCSLMISYGGERDERRLKPAATPAGEEKPVKPSQKDKCPVCGMFVAKYSDFLAQIIFKDGTYAVFDGAKDMFKYYFNLKKYNPSKRMEDIDFVYVTDYYNLTSIDGYGAYFVMGSDVFGPMGRELIPLGKEGDAREFMKDHRGKSILTFKEITYDLVRGLD